MSEAILFDIVKAVIGPLAAVGLAWLVGNRISADWAHRQRRREHSLATVADFYRMYGAFFAVWKRANYVFRDSQDHGDQAVLRDLVRQATDVEAAGEAIFLRIASEVPLKEADVRTLGLLRQGVQRLRISIVQQKILGWSSSEHPQYQAFKVLSVGVVRLASNVGDARPPSEDVAQTQLREVTHNKWSKEWDAAASVSTDAMNAFDE